MRSIFTSTTKKESKAKLEEATRAVLEAQAASSDTDNLVSTADRNVRKLRTDRERNGYAELFREVIQQPPRRAAFPGVLNLHLPRKK